MVLSDVIDPEPGLQPLTAADILRSDETVIASGPVLMRVRTDSPLLREDLARLYAGYPGTVVGAADIITDFTVEFRRSRRYRLFGAPQISFSVDGAEPLSTREERLAGALFEWGVNWCVATFVQHLLSVHAAVVERDGRALLLPGPPGAGKSTLCATLVARGWRLLTDETALFRFGDGLMLPVVRPISLKNRSIDLMRTLWPDAAYGRQIDETDKGTVMHIRPPDDSIKRMGETARLSWLVFPKYDEAGDNRLAPYARNDAFIFLARNSFNYDLLGRPAFDLLHQVFDGCEAYALNYSDVETAAAVLEDAWG